jgi:hypothetical protein
VPKSPSRADIRAETVLSSSFKNKNDKQAASGGMMPRKANEQPNTSGSIICTDEEKMRGKQFKKEINKDWV